MVSLSWYENSIQQAIETDQDFLYWTNRLAATIGDRAVFRTLSRRELLAVNVIETW